MDDQRVGRIVRALRRRRGWRQSDLARAASCSQNAISRIERGHVETASLRLIRRVSAALEANVLLEMRWHGAALERLLDEDHARLAGQVAAELSRLGWAVQPEVSYSVYGERGSIDLLAWRPTQRTLLVIELKSDLPSAEATLRKLDEKVRLAPAIATERFGWRANGASRLLIIPEGQTLRRRVALHQIFGQALPARNVAVKTWLRSPAEHLAGLWFFSVRDGGVVNSGRRTPQRLRRPKSSGRNHQVAG
jgi:transcriptional regulator with XRE-family HTH domain